MRYLLLRSIGTAVVLLGVTSLAHGQTSDCQTAYKEEVKTASDEHINEAKGCQGNSTCIAQANTKKKSKLKKAGDTLKKGNDSAKLKPIPPNEAKLDPRGQWTEGAQKGTSTWTDYDGKRWEFPNSIKNGGATFRLDKSTVKLYQPSGVTMSASAEYKEAGKPGAPIRIDGRRAP